MRVAETTEVAETLTCYSRPCARLLFSSPTKCLRPPGLWEMTTQTASLRIPDGSWCPFFLLWGQRTSTCVHGTHLRVILKGLNWWSVRHLPPCRAHGSRVSRWDGDRCLRHRPWEGGPSTPCSLGTLTSPVWSTWSRCWGCAERQNGWLLSGPDSGWSCSVGKQRRQSQALRNNPTHHDPMRSLHHPGRGSHCRTPVSRRPSRWTVTEAVVSLGLATNSPCCPIIG